MTDKMTPEDAHMTFGDHLEQLRSRLWRCVIGVAVALVVCAVFGRRLVGFLESPVIDALAKSGVKDPRLVAINVVDPLMIYIKVLLISALFLSSPWVAWQLWQFVASGLYPHERRYVHVFAPATVLLFIAGVVFSYYILVRYGLEFLIRFGNSMGIRPMLSVNTNLMFVLVLSLVMGLVFQLPLVMLILVRIHLVDSRTFAKRRKIFIIVALTLAAIVTPTQDPVTLALATIPILILYELGIWLCKRAERRMAKDLAG